MSAAAQQRRPMGEDGRASGMLNFALQGIAQFLDAPGITELAINRPGEVWTECREGWKRHEVPAYGYEECQRLATLIASYNHKSISPEFPVMSASLPDGERVQVVVPPACTPHTVSLTIRKAQVTDKSLGELEGQGAFAFYQEVGNELRPWEQRLLDLKEEGRIREFLELAVRSKRTIVIAGKTGSGKTTVARSLIRQIPSKERIVTIEDVPELFLETHPNKVHLFYSRPDEGGCRVSPRQALAACLRMKPDRIMLAELRGDEAWDFVKSVNTGHPGSISTMHANGAWESFDQMTALIKDSPAGAHLDASYVRQRLLATIDVVLYYDNRRLLELYYDPHAQRAHLA